METCEEDLYSVNPLPRKKIEVLGDFELVPHKCTSLGLRSIKAQADSANSQAQWQTQLKRGQLTLGHRRMRERPRLYRLGTQERIAGALEHISRTTSTYFTQTWYTTNSANKYGTRTQRNIDVD